MKIMFNEYEGRTVDYITPGKVYDATPVDCSDLLATIINDVGDKSFIIIQNTMGACCAHLDGLYAWTIIPEASEASDSATRAKRSRKARIAAGGEPVNVILQGPAAQRLRDLVAAGEDRRTIIERALLAL